MIDAVKQYVGVDFDAIYDDEEACKAVEAKGIDMEGCERTWGTAQIGRASCRERV